jgi:hypothetical protein
MKGIILSKHNVQLDKYIIYKEEEINELRNNFLQRSIYTLQVLWKGIYILCSVAPCSIARGPSNCTARSRG